MTTPEEKLRKNAERVKDALKAALAQEIVQNEGLTTTEAVAAVLAFAGSFCEFAMLQGPTEKLATIMMGDAFWNKFKEVSERPLS